MERKRLERMNEKIKTKYGEILELKIEKDNLNLICKK
jgi:hypothetical protein